MSTDSDTDGYSEVRRDGVRIAFRDLGDPTAEPVVLVHGLFSGGRSFDRFARDVVASGRRAIVVDQRGHGRSSKAATYRFADFEADLVAVLDHLSLDRVDLVGHSLGGHAVTLVAMQQPERVRRLVVEDAPPPPVRGDRYRGPGLAALPARQRIALLAALALRYRFVRRLDLTMGRKVQQEFRRRDPCWWERLSDITAPTLLLYGGPDSHVPGHRLEEMARRIPDCRLETVPVGHRVHMNAPDRFARLVLDFLA